MGIAGHTPNFTAAGTILPFSCVKAGTTDPFRVQVATLEDEVVLGITDGSTRAFDSTNHAVAGDPVVLQNSEFVQLRAGGTIAVGDGLRPTTNGAVIVATARIQFVACDAAVSGEIFWAQRVGAVEPALIGPGVYGSMRVSNFLRDVADRVDSVDILIAGDSNTNFGGAGWVDGMGYALQTFTTALPYATPILPTTSWDLNTYYGVDTSEGVFSRINPSGTVVNPAGSPALGGTLTAGITSGPAALTNEMNRGTGNLQPNTAPFDYGWVASGDWADPSAAVLMYITTSNLPVWNVAALNYRVVHGKGPSMGTLRLGSRRDTAPFTALGDTVISCNQASYEWVTSTLSIAADTARAGNPYAFNICSNNITSSGGGTCRMTGPMAWALHSVCTPRKGFAVTSLSHHGGANMDTVASNVVQAATIIKQYLKEARQRQIACGGSGRVIVCIQGGINAGVNPWATSATSFFQTCLAQWIALGYPERDLAFLGFVSHQANNPDTLTADRASAIGLAASSPQYTIVDLTAFTTYNDLLYGGGSGTSWFNNASTDRLHLSVLGYEAIAGRIVSTLLL
jgi:hypothetical protein